MLSGRQAYEALRGKEVKLRLPYFATLCYVKSPILGVIMIVVVMEAKQYTPSPANGQLAHLWCGR